MSHINSSMKAEKRPLYIIHWTADGLVLPNEKFMFLLYSQRKVYVCFFLNGSINFAAIRLEFRVKIDLSPSVAFMLVSWQLSATLTHKKNCLSKNQQKHKCFFTVGFFFDNFPIKAFPSENMPPFTKCAQHGLDSNCCWGVFFFIFFVFSFDKLQINKIKSNQINPWLETMILHFAAAATDVIRLCLFSKFFFRVFSLLLLLYPNWNG